MADVILTTGFFRAGFVHLVKPQAPMQGSQNNVHKYGITMMFPKDGVCPKNGQQEDSVQRIIAALDQVCQQEFHCDYNTVAGGQAGIQFPPKFDDGDQPKLNTQTNQMEVREANKNMWLFTARKRCDDDTDPADNAGAYRPGCGIVLPQGGVQACNPQDIYSGCWAIAQIKISAYMTKNNNRVLAAELHNVVKCYEDEQLGGNAQPDSLDAAFAGLNVQGANATGSAPGVNQMAPNMANVAPGGQQPMQQPQPTAQPTQTPSQPQGGYNQPAGQPQPSGAQPQSAPMAQPVNQPQGGYQQPQQPVNQPQGGYQQPTAQPVNQPVANPGQPNYLAPQTPQQ